jgi:hypothetical protein
MAESIVTRGEDRTSVVRSTLTDICLKTRANNETHGPSAPPRQPSEDGNTDTSEDIDEPITDPEWQFNAEPENRHETSPPAPPAQSALPQLNFLPPFGLDFDGFSSLQSAEPQNHTSGPWPNSTCRTSSTNSERTIGNSGRGSVDAAGTKISGQARSKDPQVPFLTTISKGKQVQMEPNLSVAKGQSYLEKYPPGTTIPFDPSSSSWESEPPRDDPQQGTNTLRSFPTMTQEPVGSWSNTVNLTGIVDWDEHQFLGGGTFGDVYGGVWKVGNAEERKHPNIVVKVLRCVGSTGDSLPAEQIKVYLLLLLCF